MILAFIIIVHLILKRLKASIHTSLQNVHCRIFLSLNVLFMLSEICIIVHNCWPVSWQIAYYLLNLFQQFVAWLKKKLLSQTSTTSTSYKLGCFKYHSCSIWSPALIVKEKIVFLKRDKKMNFFFFVVSTQFLWYGRSSRTWSMHIMLLTWYIVTLIKHVSSSSAGYKI